MKTHDLSEIRRRVNRTLVLGFPLLFFLHICWSYFPLYRDTSLAKFQLNGTILALKYICQNLINHSPHVPPLVLKFSVKFPYNPALSLLSERLKYCVLRLTIKDFGLIDKKKNLKTRTATITTSIVIAVNFIVNANATGSFPAVLFPAVFPR